MVSIWISSKIDNIRRPQIFSADRQTAMYEMREAMTRWMAPVLSFTADEIWSSLPAPKTGQRSATVFTSFGIRVCLNSPRITRWVRHMVSNF